MKFSILSMVTLAISAAASPLATRGTPTSIDQAIEQVGEVSESGDVITLLKGAISSVKGHTTAISMYRQRCIRMVIR